MVALLWAGVIYLYSQPGHDIYSEAIVDLLRGPGIVVPLNISDAGNRKAITDYHNADSEPNSDKASSIERDIALVQDELGETLSRNKNERQYQWQQFVMVSLGGPVILLVLGTVVVWVMNGFRRGSRQL